MEQKQIDQILEEIKKICPENVSVEIKKTQRRADIWLIIFTWSDGLNDIDDWAIEQVYPLQWHKIDAIIKPYHCFRAIHCRDNKFVFFARFDGVFSKFEKPLHYDAYGGAPECVKYVGVSLNIGEVIQYITENKDLAF